MKTPFASIPLRLRNWLRNLAQWARRAPVAAAACLMLLAGGCLTPPPQKMVQDAIPYIPAVTAAIGTVALQFAITDPVERRRVSDELYAVALGVRSLMGGTAPTSRQVQDAITSFGGSKSRYADLAASLGSLWDGFYPQMARGDTKLAFDVLEAVARGCETAAKRFSEQIQIEPPSWFPKGSKRVPGTDNVWVVPI